MSRFLFNRISDCPANQFYPLPSVRDLFLHWFQGQRPVVLMRAASGAKEPRRRTNADDSPTFCSHGVNQQSHVRSLSRESQVSEAPGQGIGVADTLPSSHSTLCDPTH